MAVVLLLASLPSTAGFVILFGPSQPELTVNICQPIQMFDRVSNTCSLALRRSHRSLFSATRFGHGTETARIVDWKDNPRHPTPKAHCLRSAFQHIPLICTRDAANEAARVVPLRGGSPK